MDSTTDGQTDRPQTYRQTARQRDNAMRGEGNIRLIDWELPRESEGKNVTRVRL